MTKKRPSVFDDLLIGDDVAPDTAPVLEPAPIEQGNDPEPDVAPVVRARPARTLAPAKAAKPAAEKTVHHTSIYVPKVAYKKIKDIANAEDRKAHDVIMEGVDMVLAKYGFPSLAEFKKGKK